MTTTENRPARVQPRPRLRDFVNTGCTILNDDPDGTPRPAQRTFVVLGAARGGTSMLAGVVHHLGVPMGRNLSAVYEDVEVCNPMEAGDRAAVQAIVLARNQAHDLWGFKRPAALGYLHKYQSELRNPELLVVFRDPFAIAQRNHLSIDREILPGLRDASLLNAQLIELVASTRLRTLLVSYEKALLDPPTLVGSVAAFIGVKESELLRRAERSIRPGNGKYLEQSRHRRGLGRLDKLKGREVHGWATMHGVEGPAQVEIRVNRKLLTTVTASLPRPDPRKRIHGSVDWGFVARLPDKVALKPGDEVSARVVGDVKNLRNSPLVVPG